MYTCLMAIICCTNSLPQPVYCIFQVALVGNRFILAPLNKITFCTFSYTAVHSEMGVVFYLKLRISNVLDKPPKNYSTEAGSNPSLFAHCYWGNPGQFSELEAEVYIVTPIVKYHSSIHQWLLIQTEAKAAPPYSKTCNKLQSSRDGSPVFQLQFWSLVYSAQSAANFTKVANCSLIRFFFRNRRLQL